MKFKLRTTGYFYKKDAADKLAKLGFTLKPCSKEVHIKDSFIIDYDIDVEFSSLEGLVEFTNEYGSCIVNGDTIEIYDDYRE